MPGPSLRPIWGRYLSFNLKWLVFIPLSLSTFWFWYKKLIFIENKAVGFVTWIGFSKHCWQGSVRFLELERFQSRWFLLLGTLMPNLVGFSLRSLLLTSWTKFSVEKMDGWIFKWISLKTESRFSRLWIVHNKFWKITLSVTLFSYITKNIASNSGCLCSILRDCLIY